MLPVADTSDCRRSLRLPSGARFGSAPFSFIHYEQPQVSEPFRKSRHWAKVPYLESTLLVSVYAPRAWRRRVACFVAPGQRIATHSGTTTLVAAGELSAPSDGIALHGRRLRRAQRMRRDWRRLSIPTASACPLGSRVLCRYRRHKVFWYVNMRAEVWSFDACMCSVLMRGRSHPTAEPNGELRGLQTHQVPKSVVVAPSTNQLTSSAEMRSMSGCTEKDLLNHHNATMM